MSDKNKKVLKSNVK